MHSSPLSLFVFIMLYLSLVYFLFSFSFVLLLILWECKHSLGSLLTVLKGCFFLTFLFLLIKGFSLKRLEGYDYSYLLLGFSLNSYNREIQWGMAFPQVRFSLNIFFLWLRMQVKIKLLLIIVSSLHVCNFTLLGS